jgi:hypothetical protein
MLPGPPFANCSAQTLGQTEVYMGVTVTSKAALRLAAIFVSELRR